MNKKLSIGFTVLASLAIFAGCNSTNDIAQNENLNDITNSGIIQPSEELAYDWQDINISGGNVSHRFNFENSGSEELILKGAATSCMCTSASINLPSGKISPTFGMHDNPNWQYAVKPGEKFSVDVVFDPMAHGPSATGPIQRSIYLLTSSQNNGEYTENDEHNNSVTEIKVQGNVLSRKDYEAKEMANTGFQFQETEHDFGVIKQSGGIISYDFPFTYNGEVPVQVTGTPSSCACTAGEISTKTFQPGESGVLTVKFDPNLHAEPEGKFFKTVNILTEPKLEETPEVKIWAEIDLDLGEDAYKLQDDHDDEHEDEHASGEEFHRISATDFLAELANKEFFLLDVHIPEQDHIEKTDAFIPYNEITDHLSELPEDKDAKIITYCRSGSMSLEAAVKLTELGYTNVYNLEGGRNAYIELTDN